MRKSRITSPSHSERASVTPRRKQPRSSRSMGSPARSTTSARLSNVVDKFKEDHKDSFAVSPLSKTVLSDNTEIEMPRRRSWWRKVENSRDVIEVLENEKQANPTNVLEEFDVEVLSQEKKNYTMDLPESSDSESISSIVLPQRKLFTQKENVPQNKFGQVISNRESLGKHNKTNFNDKTIDIGPKNLFAQTSKRPKPVFPSALLNMSLDKTANKTKEAPTEVKGQPKPLFGNRLGTKRKNMFADFVVSESEDEIPDIQPKLFAFHKPSEPTRRSSAASRGLRDPSPTSSITTDIEMEDWKLLPSSTMVEHQIQADLTTPGKRARLSKLSEAKESTKDTTKQSDQTMSSKNKSDNQKRNSDFSLAKAVADPDLESAHEEKTKEMTVGQPHASLIEENVQEKMEQRPNEMITNQDHFEDREPNEINTAEKSKAEAEGRTDAEQELCLTTPEKKANTLKQSDHRMSSKNKSEDQEKNTNFSSEKTDAISNAESTHKEMTVSHPHENVIEENDEDKNKLNASDKITNQEHSEDHEPEEELSNNEIEDSEHNQINTVEQDKAEANEEMEAEERTDAEQELEDDDEQIEQHNSNENKEEENITDDEEEEKEEVEDLAESDNEQEMSQEEVEEQSGDEQNKEEDEENVGNNESGAEIQDDMESNGEDLQNEQPTLEANDKEQEVQVSEGDVEDMSENEEQVQDYQEDAENENDDEQELIQTTEYDAENESGDEQEAKQASADNAEIEVSDDEIESENEENMNELQYDDEEVESQDHVPSDQEIEVDENQEINASDEVDDNEQEVDMQKEAEQEPSEVTIHNVTHDTTGRNRKKRLTETPEAVLHEVSPAQEDSFTGKGRNTSIRKTKSILKNFSIRPSIAPPRESTGLSDGTKNSSAEGSGWDSHRTTRKTLRQTFGRDFTPRKSLRALVMEKSAKRQTMINEANAKLHQANSTELQDNQDFDMEINENVDPMESDHEVSRRSRQTTLEMYLQKIKKENIERKQKIEEQVKNSLKSNPVRVDVLNFRMPARPSIRRMKPLQSAPKVKRLKPSVIPLEDLPSDLVEDMKYKPPKRFRPSNASWITKRLYKFLETKLEPKYDYKARIRAEKLVETIYNFVRDIRRLKVAPPHSVTELKREMARLDVVSTHFEFYNFFNDYLPSEIKIKVVPDIVNDIPLPREGVFAPILVQNT